jgi:hypothetical protein
MKGRGNPQKKMSQDIKEKPGSKDAGKREEKPVEMSKPAPRRDFFL